MSCMAPRLQGLLRPRSSEDVHVGSGIQFPSPTGYSRLFGVYDPYGTHSTWYCLFLLGLSSSEMATLGIFHVAPGVEPVILRQSGGVNYRLGYRFCSSGSGGPKRSWTFPRLFGDHSLFPLSLYGDMSLYPLLLGLRSRFFSPLLFSF